MTAGFFLETAVVFYKTDFYKLEKINYTCIGLEHRFTFSLLKLDDVIGTHFSV